MRLCGQILIPALITGVYTTTGTFDVRLHYRTILRIEKRNIGIAEKHRRQDLGSLYNSAYYTTSVIFVSPLCCLLEGLFVCFCFFIETFLWIHKITLIAFS